MKSRLIGYCLYSGTGVPELGQHWRDFETETWVLKDLKSARKIAAESDNWYGICKVEGIVNYTKKDEKYWTNQAHKLYVTKICSPVKITELTGAQILKKIRKSLLNFIKLEKSDLGK